MQFLKEDTAATIQFGPGLDASDGVVLETGLAAAMNHATTGIRISKNGANITARNTLTLPVYDEMGFYSVSLDATDTNTPGRLLIMFEESATCLPIWATYQVVNANVYDSLFGAGTVYLKTDLTQILVKAPNVINVTCDGVPTATNITTTLEASHSTDDALIGRVIIFDNDTTTAAMRGQAATITNYTGATGLIEVASGALTTQPVSGDTATIV